MVKQTGDRLTVIYRIRWIL